MYLQSQIMRLHDVARCDLGDQRVHLLIILAQHYRDLDVPDLQRKDLINI